MRPTIGMLRYVMILAALGLAGDFWLASRRAGPIDTSAPSVSQFGYNELRAGSVYSSLTVESYTPLKPRKLPEKKIVYAAMPVYLNGERNPFPGVEGRHLIFYGSVHRMSAIDLVDHRPLWTLDVEGWASDQAPVIDLERGKLYFSAYTDEESERGLPKLRVWLYSVNLDGSELDGFEVDIDSLFAPEGLTPPTDPSELLHCRTALGLNDEPDSHYVYFGCSMNPAPEGAPYDHARGNHGILVAAHLDEQGKLLGGDRVSAFSPSRVTDNPQTGFATGIWNSGSAPARLPGNSLLVATGNGPLIPEEDNYGCSIVRVDGRTLAVSQSEAGESYYSVDDADYRECHAQNIDIGCSATAVIEHDGQMFAVAGGKDGSLKSFDPHRLPGSHRADKIEHGIGGPICGQPIVRLNKDGQVQALAVAGNSDRWEKPSDWTIATAAAHTRLADLGYRQGPCVGLLPREKPTNGLALSLLYAGRFRHDFVALPEGGELAQQLVDGSFQPRDRRESVTTVERAEGARYVPVQGLGWLYSSRSLTAPRGFSYARLETYASGSGGLYTLPAADRTQPAEHRNAEAEPVRGKEDLQQTPAYFLASDAEAGPCEGWTAAGLEPIHFYTWSRPKRETGWVAASFVLGRDREPKPLWAHERADGTAHLFSSPVFTQAPEGQTGLAIFPVAAGSSGRLVILNAETGDLVDEIPFDGLPHFTMPLVVGDRIYMSTWLGGMYVFARESSLSNYPSRSPILRFFRGL